MRQRRGQSRTWGDAYIRDYDDVTVHSQTKYVGYGFTYYNIVGTFEGVSRVVAEIYGRNPANPYGTWFNWPPGSQIGRDGDVNEWCAATELPGGLYWITGSHSNTSD